MINDWGQIAAIGTIGGATHAILLNPTAPNSSATSQAQNTKLVGGMNYMLTPAFFSYGDGGYQTTARLLDGKAGSAGVGTYGTNRSFTQTFTQTTGQRGLETNTMTTSGTAGDVHHPPAEL